MFEVRTRVRDGETVHQLHCPGCGVWADLDGDQLHGRVSVDHTDTGCTFHETHDFAAAPAPSASLGPSGVGCFPPIATPGDDR